MELLDVRVVERFHWDWDTLDRQDEGRTERAMALLYVVNGYSRVLQAVRAQQPMAAGTSDWEAYKLLTGLDETDDREL